MKRIIFALLIIASSCTKQDATKLTTQDSFEILSYKTSWHTNNSYYANIKYKYAIDTTGVEYLEITSNLRKGVGYSFRHRIPFNPSATIDAIDLAACDNCQTIYYASIYYRNKTVKYLPEIRL